MNTLRIIEYGSVLRKVDQYAKVDTDYILRLFMAKQTICNMVDRVYAKHGKYKHVPSLEELEWDPAKYVPEKKMEAIGELAKVLEMLRYQEMVIQAQALDLGRLSSQAGLVRQKGIKMQKRYNEQKNYLASLMEGDVNIIRRQLRLLRQKRSR